MMLLFKELKKTIFSLTFVVFLAAIIIMAISQGVLPFSKDEKINEPIPGSKYYGSHVEEAPEILMPAALENLYFEFSNNSYTAYPIGFYKNVKLDDEKRRQMAEVLSELTGLPASDFSDNTLSIDGGTHITIKGDSVSDGDGNKITFQDDNSAVVRQETKSPANTVSLKDGITYEEFKECMEKADTIIGGGSDYSSAYILHRFSIVPSTYEYALADYELVKNFDHMSGAYARLFSDYLGILLSFLPAFLSVSLFLKDGRSKINELLFSRQISSIKLIFTRYLAVIIAVMVPTIILAYISNAGVWGFYPDIALDYLAPLKYCLGWLLPSAMISASVGIAFTILTNTPIAVALQGIWMLIDLNISVAQISGSYSLLQLTPRHNALGGTQIFIDSVSSLAANRLIFATAALLIVLISAVIYEKKRRGGGYGKFKSFFAAIFNRKNKSKA